MVAWRHVATRRSNYMSTLCGGSSAVVGHHPYGSAITQYDPFTVVSISFPKIATAGTKRQRQEREPLALGAG